jgi:hypothetical protein
MHPMRVKSEECAVCAQIILPLSEMAKMLHLPPSVIASLGELHPPSARSFSFPDFVGFF